MLYLLIIIISADTSSVTYKAERLRYLWKEKKLFLVGNAEVNYQDVKVFADTILYKSKDGKVYTYGNPILFIGKQKITGERMAYDLRSGKGIIKNGRSKIEKGWFDGKVIREVNKKTLNIDYGKFTTCDLVPPHYYFWSRQMKVYMDDMVFVRPLVLCVQDIPVFALPFWYFPIKKGRHSGLLYPKIGRSSTYGRYVKNIAYYWVISDYADMTYILDYMEYKGVNLEVEGVYIVRPNLAGNFESSFIKERLSGRKRWRLDIVHRQNFGKNLILRGKGNFVSDIGYRKDYEEERLKELEKVLTSYLALSYPGGSFTLEERRDLAKDKRTGSYPKVTYNLYGKRLFGGYYSYSSIAVNSVTQDESHQGFNNQFEFSRPLKIVKYFNLSPSITMRYTLYDRDKEGNRPSGGNYYSSSLSLNTTLYGRSILRKPEFRHIMRPSISYSYGKKGEDRFYSFDGIPGMPGGGKSLNFSLSNDFQLQFLGELYNLGTMNFGSSYNFKESRINPVSIDFRTSFSIFEFRASGRYYPSTHKIMDKSATTNLRFRKPRFSLNITHTMRENGQSSLWGRLSMNLTKNWYLVASRRYDLKTNRVIDESFSLKRDLHCWEGKFDFKKYGERWSYNFKIQIKAIPEVKVGKDIIKIFMGE